MLSPNAIERKPIQNAKTRTTVNTNAIPIVRAETIFKITLLLKVFSGNRRHSHTGVLFSGGSGKENKTYIKQNEKSFSLKFSRATWPS